MKLTRRDMALYSALFGTGLFAGRAALVGAQDASPAATPESGGGGGGSSETSTPSVAASAVVSEDGTEVTITHSQGETTIAVNPEKVIAFDMASVDTLDTLGIAITGLPKASATGPFEKFAADEYVDAGTLFEPDYEAVFAAEPDLIIVAGRSSAAYAELAKIAPTIDLSGAGTDTVEDLRANVLTIGAIFGKTSEAEAAIAAIDDKVATIKAEAEDAGNALVLMATGGSITAVAAQGGRGNRGGLIYNTIGLPIVVENIEEATHGEAVSFELVLEWNPDWLFVIDRDAAIGTEDAQPAEAILDNDIIHQTSAYTNDQIVYLDGYNWYIVGNGLTTVTAMLDELETALVK